MTKNARVEAAHWLRGLDHHVEEAIAALSPATGMAEVSTGQFDAQMQDLAKALRNIWRKFGSGPAQFTPREASMLRVALRDRAGYYRSQARSRRYAGPEHADTRARARAEAVAYDRLADDRRLTA